MNIIGGLGFVVALISLCISLWQYDLHKRQLKTDLLSKYCARFWINHSLIAVAEFIKKEEGLNLSHDVKIPDDYDIEVFIRYFEELELLIRAKSIDEQIVSYMFFHYISSFVKLKRNWVKIEYDSEKWKIFHEFVVRMKKTKADKIDYKID